MHHLYKIGLLLGAFLFAGWAFDRALDAGPGAEHPENDDDKYLWT